jgi:phospholipid/cholesterol/gamma-HCH transport system substrate-binding protein
MASQRTKLTVGLFMTVGITIAVMAFIWLGMSRFLETGKDYVSYFNESVQGLDKDSPVKYRGGSVGRVARVEVAPDSKLIQVIMKIETDFEPGSDIVAQLSNVGITGSMFIELDKRQKEDPDPPVLNFPSEYPIIQSKPSTIEKLKKGLDDVLYQIRALDLEGISIRVKLSLDSINQAVSDANISGLSKNLEASLENIGSIVEKERWDRIIYSVEKAMDSFESVMAKADVGINRVDNTLLSLENLATGKEKTIGEAIDEFKTAVDKVNVFLDEGTSLVRGTDRSVSYLQQNLIAIMRNLEQTTENLNRISQILADQPSQLLFGEPPAPRKIED